MPPDSAGEYALKIAVALLCGAAIGMERQWRHRLSLLQTNALVAVGAALFVSIAGLSNNAEHGSPDQRAIRATVLSQGGDTEMESIIAHFSVDAAVISASWERLTHAEIES